MHFWSDAELWGSVLGVGFLKTSVNKVGLFGLLWQGLTVGTVCLSKGSTSTSKEVSGFSLRQAFVGVDMSKAVKVYSVDVLLTF
jgi:hypothetical protein